MSSWIASSLRRAARGAQSPWRCWTSTTSRGSTTPTATRPATGYSWRRPPPGRVSFETATSCAGGEATSSLPCCRTAPKMRRERSSLASRQPRQPRSRAVPASPSGMARRHPTNWWGEPTPSSSVISAPACTTISTLSTPDGVDIPQIGWRISISGVTLRGVALRALVLILAVLFAVVPVAHAGTVSRDGDRYTFAVPSDNTAADRSTSPLLDRPTAAEPATSATTS